MEHGNWQLVLRSPNNSATNSAKNVPYQSNCTINHLPDEMLLEIFRKLEKEDSLAYVKIRRTCSRWNALLRNSRISRKLFIDISSGSLFQRLLYSEGSNMKMLCPPFTQTAVVFTRQDRIVYDLDALFATGSFIRDCHIRRIIFSNLEFSYISFCELLIILGLFQWTEPLYLEFYRCTLRAAMGYLPEARLVPVHFRVEFRCQDATRVTTEDMFLEFFKGALEHVNAEEMKTIYDLLRSFWRPRGGYPWAKALKRLLYKLYRIE